MFPDRHFYSKVGATNRTECIINLVSPFLSLSPGRPVISWKEQGCNYDPYQQPLINVMFSVQAAFVRVRTLVRTKVDAVLKRRFFEAD